MTSSGVPNNPGKDYIVANASSVAIQIFAEQIKMAGNHSRWIDPDNRYANDPIGQMNIDNRASSVDAVQIGNYVAASVVPHLYDGWTYLSYATNAIIDGDYDTATHLAYYAELRAAISFLASQGIGFFNGVNVWFDSSLDVHMFKGRTHTVVWEIMSAWAADTSKSAYILGLIKVGGKSVEEWLQASSTYVGGLALSLPASDWLNNWSIDLSTIGKDHTARNEASYQPNNFVSILTSIPFEDSVKQIIEMWKACEPFADGSFGVLDVHILRETMERALQGRMTLRPGTPDYRRFYVKHIQEVMGNLGINNSRIESILQKQTEVNTNPILAYAQSGRTMTQDVLGVYSRAFMLLRLASAASNDFLQKSDISKEDISFWWKEIGDRDDLWQVDDPPDDFKDLWEDSKLNIKDISKALVECDSKSQIKRQYEHQLWKLKRINKAILWAVGL